MGTSKTLKISQTGVLIPWTKRLGDSISEYKFVCKDGFEYFILADSDWREALAWYSLDEVKIIGLLDISKKALIPQKILPKNLFRDHESLQETLRRKGKEIFKKLVHSAHELVFIPAAICAMMIW